MLSDSLSSEFDLNQRSSSDLEQLLPHVLDPDFWEEAIDLSHSELNSNNEDDQEKMKSIALSKKNHKIDSLIQTRYSSKHSQSLNPFQILNNEYPLQNGRIMNQEKATQKENENEKEKEKDKDKEKQKEMERGEEGKGKEIIKRKKNQIMLEGMSSGKIELISLDSNQNNSEFGSDQDYHLNPFEQAGLSSDLEYDLSENNYGSGGEIAMDIEGGGLNKKTKFQLSTIFQAPRSLGHYKYITKGYRVHFSVPLCFKTALLHAHNETINIWTHFLGLVIFLVLIVVTFQLEAVKKAKFSAKLCIGVYLAGSVLCFLSSTTFHIFNCSSARIRNFVLRLDLTGVLIMIFTTVIPLMDFGFHRSRTFQIIYTTLLVLTNMFLIFFFWIKKQTLTNAYLRLSLLIVASLFALVPLAHAFFILPKELAIDFLWRIGILYLLYGIGVLFWVLKIPERWSKTGKFDIIGSSHQMWHLFVFLSAIYGYINCLYFLKYYQ
ncbi:adiponectin receptor protein [Anaeramoeba flamelloides]|uniref:Adiponectin receptor protein n=1 Tax=Anaeramoeba flamelloides TaxID=1746091 RepID=A0ABQ8Y634_9EUKA|nr:adiponectin receptor protein [Anaeramoeba flamelloides]